MKELITKPFWTSKTLWFNALILVYGILQAIEANKMQGILAMTVAIIGVYLRTLTTKPLSLN